MKPPLSTNFLSSSFSTPEQPLCRGLMAGHVQDRRLEKVGRQFVQPLWRDVGLTANVEGLPGERHLLEHFRTDVIDQEAQIVMPAIPVLVILALRSLAAEG